MRRGPFLAININQNGAGQNRAGGKTFMDQCQLQDIATFTKRAQAIVAMGLVKRNGDHFLVGTGSLRNKQGQYQVWRNQLGKVCCNCQQFTHAIPSTPNFRCEHILAVKFLLTLAEPSRFLAKAGTHTDGEKEKSITCTHNNQSLTNLTPPTLLAQLNDQVSIVGETNMDTQHFQGDETRPASAIPQDPTHNAASSFQAVLKKLTAPIPLTLIKQREGWRGRDGLAHFVDYIEWHTVADLLDQTAPQWSHAVRAITPIGGLVAITASITINGITREGVGTGPSDSEMGIKKAEHDALKRAAVKFGIARELYRHDNEADESPTRHISTNTQLHDPLAKTLADLITPKQLVAIRAIAQAQGLDAEKECQAIYSCQLEELSRQAASALIDQLKLRQQPEPQQWQHAV